MSFQPTDPRTRQVLMNIPADWTPGHKDTSFEESRLEAYAHAMRTTGRPPLPAPDLPAGDSARIALGLPVHFKPYIDAGGARIPSSTGSPGPAGAAPGGGLAPALPIQGDAGPRVTNPSELPPLQISAPEVENGDVLVSLSCQRMYSFFSLEELRFYGTKNKTPVPPTLYSYNNEGTASLHCMSTAPHFAAHSLEEHRISFLLTGRELTSDEINQHVYRL